MGVIKFLLLDAELKEIESSGIKKIIRKVEPYNPVFEYIEDANYRHARGLSYGVILITNSWEGGIIKSVHYKDGNVIIEWE